MSKTAKVSEASAPYVVEKLAGLAAAPRLPLLDVADIVRGISFPKEARVKEPQEGLIACLRTTNVQREVEWGDLWFVPPKYVKNDDQFLKFGDTLISTANSLELVGKVAFLGELKQRATLGAFISAIRPKVQIIPKYLYYALTSPETQASIRATASTTTNISNVSTKKLAQLAIPIFSLDEQRRIVAEIEEQLTRLEAGVAALKRAQANLKRYREAAILFNVTGTEGSFESHWDPDLRLPLRRGWRWTLLSEIAEVTGGLAKSSSRKTLMPTRLVPYLRVANVQRGFLDLSEIKEIEATEAEIADLRLQTGDVLFNEGGDRDKLGRGWVWNGEIPEAIHQNHVFRVRPDTTQVISRFLSYCGNSYGAAWFQKHGKQSINLASINLRVLRSFPVALPPLTEQERIVSEIDRHLSVVEELETQVEADLARADRLRQAVLQLAFLNRLERG